MYFEAIESSGVAADPPYSHIVTPATESCTQIARHGKGLKDPLGIHRQLDGRGYLFDAGEGTPFRSCKAAKSHWT